MTIPKWCILISGFRQQRAEYSGMDALFDKVHQTGTRVDQYEWDADWDEEAAWLHRHMSASCKLIIGAYSWGAGHGAVRLSEALRERGRVVDYLILADPVYRRPWVPAWFSLLPTSLTSDQKIRYPSTVWQIEWFFQRQNKPAGHQPVGARRVMRGTELQYGHSGMEDAPEFHDAVLSAL